MSFSHPRYLLCFLTIAPHFQDYYKTGVLNCPSSESMQEVREACDYLLIPFNEKTIHTNNLSEWLNLKSPAFCLSLCVSMLLKI